MAGMQKSPCLQSSDRLGTLPGILVDEILKLVPIRDVVRMSLLSKAWRYRWMYIPDLVFDSRSIPILVSSEGQRNAKFVNFVTSVLFLHNSTLHKFGISNCLASSCYDVNQWMRVLRRKSVREVILEFLKGGRYKVPSSLFPCKMLRLLKLHNCILNLPSQAKCFPSLVELYLSEVTCPNETIENLAFHSPLQKLTIVKCDGFTSLNICAPNLTRFYFDGPCEYIQFPTTPKLSYVYIALNTIAGEGLPPRNLVLAGLLTVRLLCMSKRFIEILATSLAPERELITFPQLNTLSFVMNLAESKEISTALYLIRSTPRMQRMFIVCDSTREVQDFTGNEVWTSHLHPNEIIFPELKTMDIRGFRGRHNELDFVKFILMNAKKLDRMSITWDKTVPVRVDREHVLESMMLFKRASPTAGVKFIH